MPTSYTMVLNNNNNATVATILISYELTVNDFTEENILNLINTKIHNPI
jgi:hypothetical protein